VSPPISPILPPQAAQKNLTSYTIEKPTGEKKMAIPKQQFGRSGHTSSTTIFGAASLSHVTQQDADQTLQVLLQYGVNHIDVASSYGDAELRIAPWLAQRRSQFYVATKTDARTAQEATEDVHRSLERMGIDYVDLWQLHNLVDPIEWDIALSPGGAIDAAIEAKKQGLIRAI
jgi:aryl-alcohol dehydrogenase-like predicted oxidoreductase